MCYHGSLQVRAVPGASSGWRTNYSRPDRRGSLYLCLPGSFPTVIEEQPWAIPAALGSWAPQGRYALQMSLGHELRDADTDKAPFVVQALWALVHSCGVHVAVTFDEDSSNYSSLFQLPQRWLMFCLPGPSIATTL